MQSNKDTRWIPCYNCKNRGIRDGKQQINRAETKARYHANWFRLTFLLKLVAFGSTKQKQNQQVQDPRIALPKRKKQRNKITVWSRVKHPQYFHRVQSHINSSSHESLVKILQMWVNTNCAAMEDEGKTMKRKERGRKGKGRGKTKEGKGKRKEKAQTTRKDKDHVAKWSFRMSSRNQKLLWEQSTF